MQRFLGEGGKKRVYLARDARLDRDVAVSVIKTEGLDDAGLQRIQREAQAMGRLGDQANIVTVHDIGDDQGQPYIVSQYMAGGDLEALLGHSEEHRLPIDRALLVAEQICAALDHAHGQAVIHRDLKPGNIWLAEDGSAKLGDFGLAVAIDRSRLTREGMMVGTTSYMPPEQAVGGEVTPRSDLYSLGCVLYEMVTGRAPFLGDDSVAVISQHLNTAPVAPSWHNPEVPKPLELLILKLLNKAPDERPQAASEVAAELRAIRERSTVELAADEPTAGLQGVTWGQFVGRRQEMDQLKSALDGVLSGQGTVAMLVGEPGIGKTRLAEEFAVYASLRGTQVLTGRCFEGEVTQPYRPFIEAFRQYVRSRADTELRGELGEGAPEVAKLVSEIRQRFPDIPQAQPLEAEAERLRLYESISAFVRNAATANPLVLFLDDIHWSDKPSLLMLRYLARAIAGQRVLILGAYRDVELDRTHPLSEVLATLRQETPYQRVLLRGLPQEDVFSLLRALEPAEESAPGQEALAAALYRETEGNPFFIREVLSHLVEEGKIVHRDGRWQSDVTDVSELGIPEGVREVVGRRLSRVSEGCNRMLTLASTMTGGFSWEELKAIAQIDEAELVDLVEEGLAAQLIQERKGDQAGRYDFTHALIRQTLYGELSTPRRVILHRQIGGTLEAFYGAGVDAHLSELAHHFYQAAPGGDVDKAIDYATRAGDRAVDQLAHEEAASHYELAMQALELKDAPDERQRYDLLMSLGGACYRSDLPEQATAALERAAKLGDTIGDAVLQGEAAVAYTQAVGRGPLYGTDAAVPLLERALEALPKEDSALRAALLAELSLELGSRAFASYDGRERLLELGEEAKRIAERVGDFEAKARSLEALRNANLGPAYTQARLAINEELVKAAEQSGVRSQILFARFARLGDLAELGEMGVVRQEMPAIWDLADEMREPIYSHWRQIGGAMLALNKGELEEAEQLITQYIPIVLRVQHPMWQRALNGQLYDLRRLQGRLDELEQIMLNQEENDPDTRQVIQTALAYLYRARDDSEKTRMWYDRAAANDFADVPGTAFAMTSMLLSADVARWLDDRRGAALLYDMLLPYADRQVVVPILLLCLGSASRALGQLAATLGNWSEAERHFEDAIAFDERIGTPPWLARDRYEYAHALHERDEPGDRDRALTLVNKALPVFEQIGMPVELRWTVALKMDLQGVEDSDLKTSIDAVSVAAQAERLDLRSHAAPDGTVTLLFTDIVDSTPLNERLGDQRWMELLREHNALVRQQVVGHQGYEVKTEGDGFMLAFSSARRAIECAIAIQRAFAERNRTAEEPVDVRAGLHTGEAIQDAGDFYGKHVNLAARIASQAKGGEVLVSALLKELTDSGGDIAFGEGRRVELKGLTGTQQMFAVDWAR